MRLRWWESVALGGLLVVGVLFLVRSLWLPGVVLLGLTAFVAASRAQIVERNVAGHHARTRALLLGLRWAALLSIYTALTVLLFAMSLGEWSRDSHGRVAIYATAGLAFYLARDISRYGNESMQWWAGGDAETRVAHELDQLRAHGFTVVHNLDRDGRGNVDHFVTGPTGAYAIETKSGKYRASDRGQTVSNAAWAKRKFGERWVTPVLCVGTEPPPAPFVARHGNASVWIIGRAQLRPWILEQARTATTAAAGGPRPRAQLV